MARKTELFLYEPAASVLERLDLSLGGSAKAATGGSERLGLRTAPSGSQTLLSAIHGSMREFSIATCRPVRANLPGVPVLRSHAVESFTMAPQGLGWPGASR